MQILSLSAVGMFLMAMGTLIMYLDEILLKYSINFVFNSCGKNILAVSKNSLSFLKLWR
eukprot:SAG22_NODE_349_length_11854_cov_8.087282_2_plen_59_part_00